MTKFHVGKPAPPKDLVDRKKEIRYIVEKIKSEKISYNIALLGYRRIGKTSILLKVKSHLDKDPRFVTVYFDVHQNMAEPKTFLSRLEKAIFDAYLERLGMSAKMGTKTKKSLEVFSRIKDALGSKRIKSISASLSTDGTIKPAIEFGEKQVEDYGALFNSVLQTPTAFAEKSRFRFVVILDEFQEIKQLDRYPGLKDIFGLFRSAVQLRGDSVSFVISGSRVHLLQDMLGSGRSSLFAHFDICKIEEMGKEDSMVLFNAYLKARKARQSDKAAEQAYELVGGQPFYLMAIADRWEEGQQVSSVYGHLLDDPLGALRLYAEYVLSEDLSQVQSGPLSKTILEVLSSNNDGYTVSEIAKSTSVTISKLPRYLQPLSNADIITKIDGRYSIRDRVLREYLRRQSDDLRKN